MHWPGVISGVFLKRGFLPPLDRRGAPAWIVLDTARILHPGLDCPLLLASPPTPGLPSPVPLPRPSFMKPPAPSEPLLEADPLEPGTRKRLSSYGGYIRSGSHGWGRTEACNPCGVSVEVND